jgi:hypothetical protein
MTDKKLNMMPRWDVEFWPGKIVQVEAHDEHDAIYRALENNDSEWPGGSEETGHGAQFTAWVRKVG